jgi:octaprenyl-diphosphate synthase
MLATELRAVGALESDALPTDGPFAWKQVIGPIDPFLQAVAQRMAEQIKAFDGEIAAYAQYVLTGQGKQLRPALVALSAGATGQLNDSHVTVAVIIEMVHLATLVHDDVMDEATIRRGRPTLAAQWGNEISVLLGDCLFAHALKLAAGFPTPEICRAVASATNTVCAGEILQTQRRRQFELSRLEYFRVLEMKTGELFALSCDLGACQSGAEPGARAALREFGMAMGTAYQIYDDCLDLFGSEATAGKSLGTDLTKGKLTLPVLVLLDRAQGAELEKIRALLGDWQPHYLGQIMKLMEHHDALRTSREVMAEYLRRAQQSLERLEESESRASLRRLTDYFGQLTDVLGSGGRGRR